MKKYLCIVLISLLTTNCKNTSSKNVSKDVPVDFIMMNVLVPEEFSFPSYYPLKDIQGNIHSVDSIIKKTLLVFRFSERNCEVCIQSEIELINKLDYQDKIIGLASYSNTRMLKLAKEKYNIRFPVYFLPFQDCQFLLPAPMEDYGNPYLFVMGTDFKAKHIFMPVMKYPEVSEKYYSVIFQQLNTQDSYSEIFDEKSVDLGIIKKHQTQKIRFKYSNKSLKALVIEDVKTSCGCTNPQWDKRPLEENESSELIILFTPETTGYNIKTVIVYHNQSDNPVRLIIKANVQ